MKNLRRFPVYLFIFGTLLFFQESESSNLSNWTTLLWVKAEAEVSPLDVWTNSNYPTNSSSLDFSLERLLSKNVTVFRSGKIDNWSVWKPSRLRLLFLSETGSPLVMHDFNSSDANSTEWFSAANLLQRSFPSRAQPNISYDLNLISLPRFEVTFGVHSQPDGVFGLYAGALKYNSSQYFLFSADGSLLYLPGNDLIICRQILPIRFPKMHNFTYNRWDLCVSFCRQHNFTYSFLCNTFCGCDNSLSNYNPVLAATCNSSCPGNTLELCGSKTLPLANALINEVNVSAFNPNSFDETMAFQSTDQPSKASHAPGIKKNPTQQIFSKLRKDHGITTFEVGSNDRLSDIASLDLERPFYFRNGSITVPANVSVGSSLTLELSYKLVACNDSEESFHTKTINITNNGSTTHFEFLETIGIVCAKMKLKDAAGIVNYNATLNASYIKGPALLTAPILAVQAAWEMCDCDCWVYQLLYGDSPYKNMTYAEKEHALQDTIAKIKKVLTVNKSELSATIRKKTSAEDSRVSAVVIGSTLGVAILCCSLGSIILFDLPRLLEGFLALVHNLTGR